MLETMNNFPSFPHNGDQKRGFQSSPLIIHKEVINLISDSEDEGPQHRAIRQLKDQSLPVMGKSATQTKSIDRGDLHRQDGEPQRKKLRPAADKAPRRAVPLYHSPRSLVKPVAKKDSSEDPYKKGLTFPRHLSDDPIVQQLQPVRDTGIKIQYQSSSDWVEYLPSSAGRPSYQAKIFKQPRKVLNLSSSINERPLGSTRSDDYYLLTNSDSETSMPSDQTGNSTKNTTEQTREIQKSKPAGSHGSWTARKKTLPSNTTSSSFPRRGSVLSLSSTSETADSIRGSKQSTVASVASTIMSQPTHKFRVENNQVGVPDIPSHRGNGLDNRLQPETSPGPSNTSRNKMGTPTKPRAHQLQGHGMNNKKSQRTRYITSSSESEAQAESEEDDELPRSRRSLRERTQKQTAASRRKDEWKIKHHNYQFLSQLRALVPAVDIVNEIDDGAPPTNFRFISHNHFTGKAIRPDPAALYGCSCTSGCDPKSCSCIHERNAEPKPNGEPWGLPYNQNRQLNKDYLKSRLAIFECNDKCPCGPSCRNRNVQYGRQISLEIFKTENRGWGLRSSEFIPKGSFVDTYRGEILTDTEATQRSNTTFRPGPNNHNNPNTTTSNHTTTASNSSTTTTPHRRKNIYLFALDKFKDTLNASGEKEYVIDGAFSGGPSRFINHSCEPNLRAFAVSMLRGNPHVYELAFFAVRDIPPFEELGFDYQDRDGDEDESDEEGSVGGSQSQSQSQSQGQRLGQGFGQGPGRADEGIECLCGSDRCRGWFW